MINKNDNSKEPIYKKIWFWSIIVCFTLILGIYIGTSNNSNKNETNISNKLSEDERSEIESRASDAEVARLKNLEEAQSMRSSSTQVSVKESKSSQPIQSSSKQDTTPKESTVSVPNEYLTALNKAASYSKIMYMSKIGIYEQLISEYGEKYSEAAAQYAIDNLITDYNNNALNKAKEYQNRMNMSPEAIRDQLTSEFGEKFTHEEADYAIQHLNN